MHLQSGQIKSKRPELASDQAIVFRCERLLSAENQQVLTVGFTNNGVSAVRSQIDNPIGTPADSCPAQPSRQKTYLEPRWQQLAGIDTRHAGRRPRDANHRIQRAVGRAAAVADFQCPIAQVAVVVSAVPTP